VTRLLCGVRLRQRRDLFLDGRALRQEPPARPRIVSRDGLRAARARVRVQLLQRGRDRAFVSSPSPA
jgi:hypothetical protein